MRVMNKEKKKKKPPSSADPSCATGALRPRRECGLIHLYTLSTVLGAPCGFSVVSAMDHSRKLSFFFISFLRDGWTETGTAISPYTSAQEGG